jgi:uroporphyrinogen decarboxylase
MTPRQRFQAIMRFETPDRIPLWTVENVTEGAVRRWICDGDVPLGLRKDDVLPPDPRTEIRLDLDPLPAFVPRVICEDEDWRTSIDQYGFTVRTSKWQNVGPTHYAYLAGSVADRDDWRRMTRRFDPADPRRLPREWSDEFRGHLNESPGPVGMRIDWGPGRGIKNGYMLGTGRFLEALTDEPALIEEMFDFWADFAIETARPWLDGVRFDYVYFNEDGMGFKNSTLVSPEMFRRIWSPRLARVAQFLRSRGVEIIGYSTSGNIRPLIGVLLEIGISLHMPLECAAGMDARALRRQFGRDLRMIGNISRGALARGPEAVEREFGEKVPPLMEAGGYIPAIDDLVLPEVPFASYRRFAELVRAHRLP